MLSVYEIFKSIQGESTYAGELCSFVRLSGCNLHCTYCDTEYARQPGVSMTIEDCLHAVQALGCTLVEITGGEPLLQPETPDLCGKLIDAGNTVLVETNGSLDIAKLPSACVRIADVKCPGSGMEGSFFANNINALTRRDQVKFVISDVRDFDWSLDFVKSKNLLKRCIVIFSPNTNELKPKDLAEWIVKANVPVRLGLQLHKILWGNEARGK
jgi:7-carboxy-7-deazaguanine synthase